MADSTRSKLLSLDAARAERLYITLMDLMESYCMEEAPSSERERAVLRFFGGDADLATLPETTQDEFLDWFAFSYRTEDAGERMVERFGEEHQRLTGQAILPGLHRSRLGFFTVAAQKGFRHELVDLLTGEQLTLSLEGDFPAPKGSLFYGRLIPVGDLWRPGFTLDSIPPDLFDLLQPLLQVELDRMRLAFPEVGWSDLLQERWPLLRDLMMMRTEHEPVNLALPDLPPAPNPSGEGVPGAPDVAFALQSSAEEMGLAQEDAERLVRLWYDAAALLQPRIQRPETWAAGAAWAFYTVVDELPLTQADIADAFEVSPGTVGQKGRQVVAALGVVPADDRYADPLSPSERLKRLLEVFGPEALKTLYE